MSSVTSTSTVQRKSASSSGSNPSSVPFPSNGKLCIKIGEKWFDLTQWKHQHPGGADILEHLNGQDASDAFYSLHSKEASERLNRLGGTTKTPAGCIEPTPSKATVAFRQFRQELINDGWFQRNWMWEAFYAFQVYALATVGTYFALTGSPILAFICIGLSMQHAGWIGHDYTHGRGQYVWYSGMVMAPLINGFSRSWWSDKHNTHHVYTNHVGVDSDIENDPILHLFIPNKQNDVWFRKYQHFYYPLAYSFLFVSWRIQSLQTALKNNNVREWTFMILNYSWLYFLGWKIALASVLLSGFIVAIVVTATHQSEEMLSNDRSPYDFITTQFNTTRDAACPDFFSEWMWGGMQYQLEHHIFPTMPRYYYPRLQSKLREFASRAGLDYRIDGMWAIWIRNYQTMKQYAAPAKDE